MDAKSAESRSPRGRTSRVSLVRFSDEADSSWRRCGRISRPFLESETGCLCLSCLDGPLSARAREEACGRCLSELVDSSKALLSLSCFAVGMSSSRTHVDRRGPSPFCSRGRTGCRMRSAGTSSLRAPYFSWYTKLLFPNDISGLRKRFLRDCGPSSSSIFSNSCLRRSFFKSLARWRGDFVPARARAVRLSVPPSSRRFNFIAASTGDGSSLCGRSEPYCTRSDRRRPRWMADRLACLTGAAASRHCG